MGKTFLLTHAWAADHRFLFTAARTTPELNRQQLLHDLAAWTGETFDPADLPSWRTVFRLLVDVATNRAYADPARPTIIVLDEFQRQHTLEPFTYWFAAELAAFESLRDRALAYGVFGGTPPYLAAIDARRSLAENATDLLLSPRGEVRLLVETALD